MAYVNTFMAGLFTCQMVDAAIAGQAWLAVLYALTFSANAFAAFINARKG